MKLGIVGDIHWSRYSSILRLRGNKYSHRLENCIKSITWAEQMTSDCALVIYLGDFFDSPELTAEEITAIKDIKWNSQEHFFLVGNHEMGINDLSYSSSHLFDYIDIEKGATVIDSPCMYNFGGCAVNFLPYILEDSRKPISEYIQTIEDTRTIVFSHNDIAGIQLGQYVSKAGFDINDIEEHCDLFINGHLHNGSKISDKIINIGNLTGQNFSEDAFKYDHCIFILDTDTMQIAVYENPYAINFYKIDATETDVNLTELKQNAVVTLKVPEDADLMQIKNTLDSAQNIITYRILVVPGTTQKTVIKNTKELLAVNHLTKFSEYVLQTLGKSDVVVEELDEVLK